MPRQMSADEFIQIASRGPRAEYLPAALIAELQAASVPASGEYATKLYSADGFYDVVIALTSTQAGAINLLRFVDDAGTVKLDTSAPTQAITANTPAVLASVDGLPYASFKVEITNSGGSAATLSNIAILQSAH